MSSQPKSVEQMSAMGLGTSVLASLGRALPKKDAQRLIQTALDHGIITIDTSDAYGAGDSERIIRFGLGTRRDECFLMTKAGFLTVNFPSFLSPLNQIAKKALSRVLPKHNFSKTHIINALESSLKRLGTDHVNAFFLHEPDIKCITSESWEALKQIKDQGKSLLTGVSTASLAVITEGLQSGQVNIVQTPVSIDAKARRAILETCEQQGIPVVANEVLRPNERLLQNSAWKDMLSSHGIELQDSIAALLAFAKNQPGVRTVLCGTRSNSHMLDNLKGIQRADAMQSLTADMEKLEE